MSDVSPDPTARRTAEIDRETGETQVHVALMLGGKGSGTRSTGVGFLDHMLDLVARHARLDLDVAATGRPSHRCPPHG